MSIAWEFDMSSSFEFANYQFKNPEILTEALTHKSFAYEGVKLPANKVEAKLVHNEKLEFLGDAVLDLVLSEYLMEVFPQAEEGDLSKMRAHLVNETGLALQAERLGLSQHLRLGKGEAQSGGAQKPRLLASGFEALVGALFREAGFNETVKIVRGIFSEQVQELQVKPEFDQDYKSQLQELVQGIARKTPIYELQSQLGPAHDRVFEVRVMVGDLVLASGHGKTKKSAEQKAAELGLQFYRQNSQVSEKESES
jgi:ribonuclease-3